MGVMCLNLIFACVIVFIYSFILVSLEGGGGHFAGKLFTNVSKVLVTRFSDFHLVINFLAVYVQFIHRVRLDLPVYSLFESLPCLLQITVTFC